HLLLGPALRGVEEGGVGGLHDAAGEGDLPLVVSDAIRALGEGDHGRSTVDERDEHGRPDEGPVGGDPTVTRAEPPTRQLGQLPDVAHPGSHGQRKRADTEPRRVYEARTVSPDWGR